MLNTTIGLKKAVCLAASVLLGASASAAIIYDNTETFTGRITGEESGTEIGDVVVFGGTDRILTDFQFEYFVGGPGGTAASGNEMAQVFLRAMDGPSNGAGGNLPGTILWQSGQFSLESGYHQIDITGLNVTVPNSVAWTVVFTGIDNGNPDVTTDDELAGLLFYLDSNTEGGVNPTFFDSVSNQQEPYTIRRGTDGGWELLNHPNVVDNLGARFTAVPEPTTWALLLGGLATIGLLRRRKS